LGVDDHVAAIAGEPPRIDEGPTPLAEPAQDFTG